MTEIDTSAGDDERPAPRPIEEEPGRRGCGPIGCMYALVILFAFLLAVMVAIALFRPWPRAGVPGL